VIITVELYNAAGLNLALVQIVEQPGLVCTRNSCLGNIPCDIKIKLCVSTNTLGNGNNHLRLFAQDDKTHLITIQLSKK